jgi:hypothetical protein
MPAGNGEVGRHSQLFAGAQAEQGAVVANSQAQRAATEPAGVGTNLPQQVKFPAPSPPRDPL